MSRILYRGPSRLDDTPIIMVGVPSRACTNQKTGQIVATYILHADLHPLEAVRSGADRAVCGGCKRRGDHGRYRTCYVRVDQAPATLWSRYHTDRELPRERLPAFGAGDVIRLGSYGDPAAVPADIWHELLKYAAGWVGYTQCWRGTRFRHLQHYCMASVNSDREAVLAESTGWRYFRVAADEGDVDASETVCAAYMDGTRCLDCRLCSGLRFRNGPSVVIPAHGSLSAMLSLARQGSVPTPDESGIRNRQLAIPIGTTKIAGPRLVAPR